MRTKKVIVVPYNPAWKDEFEILRTYLERALGNTIVDIEHVGSTSVNGLSAKPIIDLDVIIESHKNFEEVKCILEDLGYYHEGDLGITGREAFGYEDKKDFMAHHLYVCPKESLALKNHLSFRNYLRVNKEVRDRYSEVKEKAALEYLDDIDEYMKAKCHIINEIYKKIGL